MCADARRRLDLGAVGAGAAVGDVVFDRVVEQHRVLRDDADRRAQARLRHARGCPGRRSRSRPRVDVVEAEQQPRQRATCPTPDGPTTATVLPAGISKLDAVQDLAVGVVAEAHVARSAPRRRATASGSAPGRVGDLAVLAEQREHLLHVDQRLLDLAVDHAEEVERDVELDHQRVDQHQVAERHRPGDDADGRAPHQQRHRAGDDQALAEVEQRQRGLRLDRRLLEALQVLVVARLLERLVARST